MNSAYIRLLRPAHWVKNLFVFAPLVFAGHLTDSTAIKHATIAFVCFCATASAVYIINDLRDITADQRHPLKRHRPLASGEITRQTAMIVAGLLLALATGLIAGLPVLAIPLFVYLVIQVAYTYVLKHQPVLDLFAIAAGFVLRVYGGAVAIDVVLSNWMFITVLALALFLASVKRRKELELQLSGSRAVLTAYSPALVTRYAEMAAICAIVFYSLFVLQDAHDLIVTVPLVLFGIFRYWYIAERTSAGEDPTAVLIRDPYILATVAAWAALCAYVISTRAAG